MASKSFTLYIMNLIVGAGVLDGPKKRQSLAKNYKLKRQEYVRRYCYN